MTDRSSDDLVVHPDAEIESLAGVADDPRAVARNTVKLGTAPITWGVSELDDWGVMLPSDRVLDEMAEVGYTGTELGPWGYLPKGAAALERELRKRRLALAGAFCPVTLHDPARYEEQFAYAMETSRLLADLGAPVLVLAEAGDAKRVRHVHLKDVYRDRYRRALERGLDFTAAVGEDVFAPVGAGSIDMAGVLGTLRDAGFDGWLIVEQDIRIAPGSSREPKLDAAKSYSFVTTELG